MDKIAELAVMFKERENQPYMGPQTGVVVSPPPSLTVKLTDKIILDKDHLIIAAHVLAGYQRDIEIPLTSTVSGETSSVTVGDHGNHVHSISSIGITGQLKYTDTLKAGDEVILIPATDIQTYYLIDKVVRL